MDASLHLGPPREVLPLYVHRHQSEIHTRLDGAELRWPTGGDLIVTLRGVEQELLLHFTPIQRFGEFAVTIQARLLDERGVAVSLRDVGLQALRVTSEEQEPLLASPEAHTLALAGFSRDRVYMLEIKHRPFAARGAPSPLIRPDENDGILDWSDGCFGGEAELAAGGRRGQLIAVG